MTTLSWTGNEAGRYWWEGDGLGAGDPLPDAAGRCNERLRPRLAELEPHHGGQRLPAVCRPGLELHTGVAGWYRERHGNLRSDAPKRCSAAP